MNRATRIILLILVIALIIVSKENTMPPNSTPRPRRPVYQGAGARPLRPTYPGAETPTYGDGMYGPPKPANLKKKKDIPWWEQGPLNNGLSAPPMSSNLSQPTYGPQQGPIQGPPAPLSPYSQGLGGGYMPQSNPTWWEKAVTNAKKKLNQLGPTTGLGGGGLPIAQFPMQDNNPAAYPTGSFLGGSGQNLGDYNLAAAAAAENPAVYPTGTFLSGSGGVNTGYPVFPVLPGLDDQGAGGGGMGTTYGSNWKKKRYGGGGSYGGSGYAGADYNPAFYLGLNSWNYGE